MLLPNLPPPTEGIRHQSSNIDAYISQRCLGTGTLYIAESQFCWAKDNSNDGITLQYPHISVHAVCKDTSNFQYPCLYLMTDVKLDNEEQGQSNGYHSEEDEDDDNEEKFEMSELRFVARDENELDLMYKALNECQLLHPDPEDVDDGEDVGYDLAEEDAGFEDNEEEETEEDNANRINRDEEMEDEDEGQFEDA